MAAVCLLLVGCGYSPPRVAHPSHLGPVVVIVRADQALAERARASAVALGERLTRQGWEIVPRTEREERDPAPELAAIEESFFALATERAAHDAGVFLGTLETGGFGRFDRALLIRTLMLLAEASASAGDDAASTSAIDRALDIDAGLVLDPVHFSPVLRARVDARRGARHRASVESGQPTATAAATITFGAMPAGAQVWIDGQPAALDEAASGAGPTLALAPGRHVVRVEAPGYAPETRALDLAPEGATFEAGGRRTPSSLDGIAGEPGSPLADEAAAVLEELGYTAWVLDVRAIDGRASHRWWRADRSVLVTRELAFDEAPVRVAELLDGAVRTEERERVAAGRRHHRRRLAGWLGASVAASAGAVTTAVMLRPVAPTRWVARGTIEGAP